MKSKTFIAVVLIAALVGGAIWWSNRQNFAPPVKSIAGTVPVGGKVEAPKSAPAQIAAVVATPEDQPRHPAQPPDASPVKGNAPAELKAVLDDGADLILAGDTVTFVEKYMPPALLAMVSAQDWADLTQQAERDKVNPRERQFAEEGAQAYRSLESQTPVMNAVGDEATYQMTPLPNPRDPRSADAPPTDPVTFKKIEGNWYLETWPLNF